VEQGGRWLRVWGGGHGVGIRGLGARVRLKEDAGDLGDALGEG
jgi:hypothetical protein